MIYSVKSKKCNVVVFTELKNSNGINVMFAFQSNETL